MADVYLTSSVIVSGASTSQVIESGGVSSQVIESGFGNTGAESLMLTADVPIGGHRVVRATSTGCNYADSSDKTHIGKIIGITLAAYSQGADVEIHTHGEWPELSWNWALGPIYLGTNGLLTQTIPTSGFVQQVATAIAPTRIFIEIQPPIEV